MHADTACMRCVHAACTLTLRACSVCTACRVCLPVAGVLPSGSPLLTRALAIPASASDSAIHLAFGTLMPTQFIYQDCASVCKAGFLAQLAERGPSKTKAGSSILSGATVCFLRLRVTALLLVFSRAPPPPPRRVHFKPPHHHGASWPHGGGRALISDDVHG